MSAIYDIGKVLTPEELIRYAIIDERRSMLLNDKYAHTRALIDDATEDGMSEADDTEARAIAEENLLHEQKIDILMGALQRYQDAHPWLYEQVPTQPAQVNVQPQSQAES